MKQFSIKACFDVSHFNLALKQRNIPQLATNEGTLLLEFLEENKIIGKFPINSFIEECAKVKSELGSLISEVPDGVTELVQKSLPEQAPTFLKEDVVEYFVEKSGKIGTIDELSTYSVTAEDIDESKKLDHAKKLHTIDFLSVSQVEVLESYIRLLIRLRENVQTLISIVQSKRSTLLDLDNPEITLRKLTDVFSVSIQEKGDVIQWVY